MFYSRLINKAIDLAYETHKNQRDKAGRPYFVHPLLLASRMDSEFEICAALLHDVVEDSDLTIEDIQREFPREVADAVRVLTHDENTSYLDYIEAVKNNPIARKVKLADLEHNLDITRIADRPELLAGYERRRKRYETARSLLLS